HGAGPRVEPTEITVTAVVAPRELRMAVHDTGAGAAPEALAGGDGTGLARLRDRLMVLYGGRARLDLGAGAGGGFTASLMIPRGTAEEGPE
ncbi:MAG TPA: sensor histidine kinase, partial [Thermoanaerobaculia bacterium]|nr:sensor histidine kinase [Thermoanaerobaculia bacterium]